MSYSPFPIQLSQLLNSSNFSYTPGETRVSTDMDVGPAKVRSRFTDGVDIYQCEIDLDITLISVFKTFYKVTCGNGTLPFTYPDPFTQAVTNFRFFPGHTPQITPLGSGGVMFTLKMVWEVLP